MKRQLRLMMGKLYSSYVAKQRNQKLDFQFNAKLNHDELGLLQEKNLLGGGETKCL